MHALFGLSSAVSAAPPAVLLQAALDLSVSALASIIAAGLVVRYRRTR